MLINAIFLPTQKAVKSGIKRVPTAAAIAQIDCEMPRRRAFLA